MKICQPIIERRGLEIFGMFKNSYFLPAIRVVCRVLPFCFSPQALFAVGDFSLSVVDSEATSSKTTPIADIIEERRCLRVNRRFGLKSRKSLRWNRNEI